jgi:hypothetical protein
MNKKTNQLDRLLESAAQAPSISPGPLSFRTEEVAIASWKTKVFPEQETWATTLYTPALVGASAIVVLCLILNYMTPATTNASEAEWAVLPVQQLCTL